MMSIFLVFSRKVNVLNLVAGIVLYCCKLGFICHVQANLLDGQLET